MKLLVILAFMPLVLLSQTTLKMDRMYQYNEESSKSSKTVYFMTSNESPEFSVFIDEHKKDSLKILVYKYDQWLSMNIISKEDFAMAEIINIYYNLKHKPNTINDFKWKFKHYQTKIIQDSTVLIFEMYSTLSVKKQKKKGIARVTVEILPESETWPLFSNFSVYDWWVTQKEPHLKGIPKKMIYQKSYDSSFKLVRTLVDYTDISKKFILEF